ncbi:MAG: TatD family hydrolase [Candidatus Paceibacterota bacterium]
MVLPSYFDIHAHVNLDPFRGREFDVLKEALNENVWVINVGVDRESSSKALELADGYQEGVYATAGIYPVSEKASEPELRSIKELARQAKVVALGECGLDYFHVTDEVAIKEQKELFLKQIEIANEVGKPLMLHLRNGDGGDAYKDAIALLKDHARVAGNSHFFSGTLDNAKDLFSLGFSVSFTGVVTFSSDYDQLVREAPLDMIMSETDSPYVAPLSIRGKENRPVYVKEVAERIVEIRKESKEKIRSALVENACRVFNICHSL